jgi:hypothetical protein
MKQISRFFSFIAFLCRVCLLIFATKSCNCETVVDTLEGGATSNNPRGSSAVPAAAHSETIQSMIQSTTIGPTEVRMNREDLSY